MTANVRILGIDPGSLITGYGVVDAAGSRTRYVASGCIRVSGKAFTARLQQIYAVTCTLIEEHNPDMLAIERVFMHRNADSALKLGQARAAALCAGFAAATPPQVHEYAAREIKLAVVGKGSAAKEQVQHMVRVLLKLQGAVQADAADALAVALCHAYHRATRAKLDVAAGGKSGA